MKNQSGLMRPYALAKGFRIAIVIMAISTIIPQESHAQTCTLQISGRVTDKAAHSVDGALIVISSKDSISTMSDTDGTFSFNNLCAGNYLLNCSMPGYKSFSKTISLSRDKNDVVIRIATDDNEIAEVVVNGEKQQEIATVAHSSLTGQELMEQRGKTLGESLKELAGVNAMESGPTLAKPMIHGLSGNRVLLMNNGVRQEGQQWGDDHAPELDPFTASNITVVKGAASIRYGSDAIAGVVLLDPPSLPTEKGISGDINAVGSSNGRMGSLSADAQGALGGKLDGLSWRVQGTLQRAGNFSTPHYYLTNTGVSESDYMAQIGYKKRRFTFNASYSSYNSKIGIYAGAEAGNAQDLLDKYEQRDSPLVPSLFTYKIDRSYQSVNHDILKIKAGYDFANKSNLELTYSRQYDLRQEYSSDVVYTSNPDLANAPENWFKIITHNIDLVYKIPYLNGFSGSMGITGSTQGNVFRGVSPFPLIPNYRNYGAGVFAIGRYENTKWTLEAGLRYDYLWRRVYRYDENILGTFANTFDYNNVTGTAGATYKLNNHFSLNANFGIGWRPPSAEEMFIHGVHFSAMKYEIGDSSLTSERSYNTTLTVNYHTDKLRVIVDLYDNEINNFIYANPIGQIITVDNYYFAYQFVQDDVRLLGADITGEWDILKQLTLSSKTSLLRATNKTRNEGLINMPPARLQNGLTYHLSNLGKIKEPYFTLENVSVLHQGYVAPGSDYEPTPPGYSLWNVNLGCKFPIGKNLLDLNFAVDNLTNKVYSDYMNQFRFYAYDLGINFTLRAKFSF